MTPEKPTPDRIMQLANGYWATGILGAAAYHSFFNHLQAGEDTAAGVVGDEGERPDHAVGRIRRHVAETEATAGPDDEDPADGNAAAATSDPVARAVATIIARRARIVLAEVIADILRMTATCRGPVSCRG